MPKITVDVWAPRPDDGEAPHGFVIRVAGRCDDKPFCVDYWYEFDGRDIDADFLYGDPGDDSLCDLPCVIMSEMPGFNEAFDAAYKAAGY